MPVSRREFLGSVAATGAAAAVSPAFTAAAHAGGGAGATAPFFDDQLPIHHPEQAVSTAGDPMAHAFAAEDDAILNHGLTPEWHARVRHGMRGPV